MKHAILETSVNEEEIVDLLFQLDEKDVVAILKKYTEYNASKNFEETMLKYFVEVVNCINLMEEIK